MRPVAQRFGSWSLCLLVLVAGAQSAAAGSARVEKLLPKLDSLSVALQSQSLLHAPVEWRRQGARLGLPALDLPREVGGRTYSASEMTQVLAHLGQYSLDLRDAAGGAHGRLLLKSDTPEVRAIAADVAKGKAYVAIGITEEDSGSNHKAMKSVAVRDGDHYLLTGEKKFVARLATATHVILFARSAGTSKLNAFAIPTDWPDLHIHSLEAHGLYGNSFGSLSFQKMRVPSKFRIGKDGDGDTLFNDHFRYWRLLQAAAAVGSAQAALDRVPSRLLTREAFGRPLGGFTHLQQQLAQHATELHAASLVVADAARRYDADPEAASPYIAMSKGEGVEWALRAADFAMRTFGAAGYSPSETDLGQRVRDLKGMRVADGATEVMRTLVVRGLYGEEFFKLAVGAKDRKRLSDDDPAQLLSRLQSDAPGALPAQENYNDLVPDKGGGPCPVVAAAALTQALSVMTGHGLVDVDRAIRAIYKDKPELRAGQLTNAQVVDVLSYFSERLVPGVRPRVQVDYVRSMQKKGNPEGAQAWTDLDSSLLQTRRGELKLVTFDVVRSGQWIGRHFVLLKQNEGGKITVVDLNNPKKDHIYQAKRVSLGEKRGSSMQLVRPDKDDGNRLTINSVFSVSLEGAANKTAG